MVARHLPETFAALDLVRSGKTITQAAEILGLHRRTVWRIVVAKSPELIKLRKVKAKRNKKSATQGNLL